MIQAIPAVPSTVKLIPAVRAHPVTVPVPPDLIPTAQRILSDLNLNEAGVEIGQHHNGYLFLSVTGPPLLQSTRKTLGERVWKELTVGVVYSPPTGSQAVRNVFASYGARVVELKVDSDGEPVSGLVVFPPEKHVYLTTGTDLTDRMSRVAGFEMQSSKTIGQHIPPFHGVYSFRKLEQN